MNKIFERDFMNHLFEMVSDLYHYIGFGQS